jgi:hypothetical protein
LQHSINILNCGEEHFGTLKQNAPQHLLNLKSDYEKDFKVEVRQIIKRNKLTQKGKQCTAGF